MAVLQLLFFIANKFKKWKYCSFENLWYKRDTATRDYGSCPINNNNSVSDKKFTIMAVKLRHVADTVTDKK